MTRIAAAPRLRLFQHDGRGATAIEFAMIGPILITLLIAIVESGFDYYVTAQMDTVAWSAADAVKTGTYQINHMSFDTFKQNAVCPYLPVPIACSTVKVTVFTEVGAQWYGGIGLSQQPIADLWCPGGSKAYVTVLVAAPVPVLSGLWNSLINRPAGWTYLSAATIRNDPFAFAYVAPAGCNG